MFFAIFYIPLLLISFIFNDLTYPVLMICVGHVYAGVDPATLGEPHRDGHLRIDSNVFINCDVTVNVRYSWMLIVAVYDIQTEISGFWPQ